MKKSIVIFVISILSSYLLWAQKTKQEVIKSIDDKSEQYATVAHTIWEYAEVGFSGDQEFGLVTKDTERRRIFC